MFAGTLSVFSCYTLWNFVLDELVPDFCICGCILPSHRSLNIIRMIKCIRISWAGHVATMEEGMSALKILTDKPTGNRPLGRRI